MAAELNDGLHFCEENIKQTVLNRFVKQSETGGICMLKSKENYVTSIPHDDIASTIKNRSDMDANSTEIDCLTLPDVVYVYSKEHIELCDKFPKIAERASMTHKLIAAYNLLKHMRIVSPRKAEHREICNFHSSDYVTLLQDLNETDETDIISEKMEEYGLGYDCGLFDGVFDYASACVGGTLTAAECLLDDSCKLAIHWQGGWHHAIRDSASGFCYLNDIVIGILKLMGKFPRILYVDIDLHHGDGVQYAFEFTSKVFTLSFHKFSKGFFPGTGTVDEVGTQRGKFYSCNVPLNDGIDDKQFTSLFSSVLKLVLDAYQPLLIVCQCGLDGLTSDPMSSLNLTHHAFGYCVKSLQNLQIPLLLLGGGGYNLADSARTWTYITACILNQKIPVDIPDHEYFLKYGPDYQIQVPKGHRTNRNTEEELRKTYFLIKGNLENIRKYNLKV